KRIGSTSYGDSRAGSSQTFKNLRYFGVESVFKRVESHDDFGSRMSRRRLPLRLTARINTTKAIDGGTMSPGLLPMYCKESEIMLPKSASGGRTPNPKKLKAA